jgi:hypothetical protein
MRKAFTAGLCLLLLGMSQANGQDRTRVREKETAAPTRVRRASHLLGSRVMVRGGTELGKVADLVISEDGSIDYVIVRYRDELVPVPWGAVRYDIGERVLTVTTDVTPDRLRGICFREERWPDFSSERWMRSARSVWGEKALRRYRGPEAPR